MRLYETLHVTIKWKKVLLWYLCFTVLLVLNTETVLEMIVGFCFLTFFLGFLSLMVFGKAIHGNGEAISIVWPFKTIYEKQIFYGSLEGKQRRQWCRENLNGKWIHCQHGYFVFQRKDEAMAFKLICD